MIEDVFLEMNRRRQHGALSASGGNNYVAPLHGYVPHIGSRQVQSALPTSPPVLAAPAAPQGWQGYPYPQPFYHNTSFARSEQQQLPTLQELQAQLPPGLAQGVNGTALGYADIQGLGSVAPVPQLQPYPGDNIPIDPALSAYDEEMEMNEEQLRQLAPPEQGQENGSHGNNQNQNQNQNQNRRHRQERQPHGTAQSSLRRGQPQAQQRVRTFLYLLFYPVYLSYLAVQPYLAFLVPIPRFLFLPPRRGQPGDLHILTFVKPLTGRT